MRNGSCNPALPRFGYARLIGTIGKRNRHAEEWLLIEWPRGEAEPTKYWISTLPSDIKLNVLIKMAKHRWIIERDYEELETRVGTGSLREGRNWRGFHHHATLCIAAYGFLVAERNRFSPSARSGHPGFFAPGQHRTSAPAVRRHAPSSITRIPSRPCASFWRGCCCDNCLTVRSAGRLRVEHPCRNLPHQCRFALASAVRSAIHQRAVQRH